MEIERDPQPESPPPTFTARLSQRELDLLVVATDMAGTKINGTPVGVGYKLRGEIDELYGNLSEAAKDESEGRLGLGDGDYADGR